MNKQVEVVEMKEMKAEMKAMKEMKKVSEPVKPKVKKTPKSHTFIKVVESKPHVIITSNTGHSAWDYQVSRNAKRKGAYQILDNDIKAMKTLYKNVGNAIIETPQFTNYLIKLVNKISSIQLQRQGSEIPYQDHEDLRQNIMLWLYEAIDNNDRVSFTRRNTEGEVLYDEEGKAIKWSLTFNQINTWTKLHSFTWSLSSRYQNTTARREARRSKVMTHVTDEHVATQGYETSTTQPFDGLMSALEKALTHKQLEQWSHISNLQDAKTALSPSERKQLQRITERLSVFIKKHGLELHDLI